MLRLVLDAEFEDYDCEYYVNKFRKEAAQKIKDYKKEQNIEEEETDYIEETCNTYRDTEKTDCEKVLINDQTKVTTIMTEILNDPDFLKEEIFY